MTRVRVELMIQYESVLNQNTVKVYTDGLKLGGRVGAGFYAEYPSNSQKQAFFHLGIYSTVFQAEALVISEVAKKPAFGKNAESNYCCAELNFILMVKQLSKHSSHKMHCNINYSVQLH